MERVSPLLLVLRGAMDAVMRSVVVRKQGMRNWWQGFQALSHHSSPSAWRFQQQEENRGRTVCSSTSSSSSSSSSSSGIAFFSSTPEHQVSSLKPKVEMLKGLGLREEEIEKLVPRIQGYSVDNVREKVSFLENSAGVRRKSLVKLISSDPAVFGRSIEHSLKPKVEFLKDLGLKDEDLGRVVPFVVDRSLQGMLQKITFLESSGFKRDRIGSVIAAFPRIFSYNLENNLKKKTAFLESEATGGESVAQLLTTHPAVLGRSLGNLSRRADFLRSKGLKASLLVRGPCADVSTRRLKAGVDRLVGFGFRMTDAASQMLKKQPNVLFRTAESIDKRRDFLAEALQCSIEEAEQIVLRQPSILNQSEKGILSKLEFLVNNMGYSKKEMMKYPQFLTSSLEAKIKPRHRVLESLKSLDLLKKKDANFLSILLKMSEKEFVQKFVQGSPEAAALYKGSMLLS